MSKSSHPPTYPPPSPTYEIQTTPLVVFTQNVQRIENLQTLPKKNEIGLLQELKLAPHPLIEIKKIERMFPDHKIVASKEQNIGILIPKIFPIISSRNSMLNNYTTAVSANILFHGKPITIISVYRSHVYHPKKRLFWENLIEFMEKFNNPIIVGGDFNTECTKTIERSLNLMNVNRHKIPTHQKNTIDHILVPKPIWNQIRKTTIKDKGVADHLQIKCEIELRSNSNNQTDVNKEWNCLPRKLNEKLKTKILKNELFQDAQKNLTDPALVDELLLQICQNNRIKTTHENERVQIPLDMIKEKRRLVKLKNQMKKRNQNLFAINQELNQINKNIRMEKYAAQNVMWKQFCRKEREKVLDTGSSRLFKILSGKNQISVDFYENDKEQIHEPKKMAEAYQDFAKDLLESRNTHTRATEKTINQLSMNLKIWKDSNKLLLPFSEEEVESVRKHIKNTAPGPYLSANESINGSGLTACLFQELPLRWTDILNQMWDWKPYFNRTLMIPLPKKKSNRVEDQRPIQIAPLLTRIFNKILGWRLQNLIIDSQLIPDNQFGWKPGVSCVNHISELVYNYKKSPSSVLVSFDFTKAFDSVEWKTLEMTLKKLGMAKELTSLLMKQQTAIKTNVLIQNQISSGFVTGRGVKQGDPISPHLFKIYLLPLMEAIRKKTPSIQQFYFADDSLLLSKDALLVQLAIDNFVLEAAHLGLQVNAQKTLILAKKDLTLAVNGTDISTQKGQHGRILGIIVDSQMRWNQERKKIRDFVQMVATRIHWLKSEPDLIPTMLNPIIRGFVFYHGAAIPLSQRFLQRLDGNIRKAVRRAIGLLPTVPSLFLNEDSLGLGICWLEKEVPAIMRNSRLRSLNLNSPFNEYLRSTEKKITKWFHPYPIKDKFILKRTETKPQILKNQISGLDQAYSVGNLILVGIDGSAKNKIMNAAITVIDKDSLQPTSRTAEVISPYSSFHAELGALLLACRNLDRSNSYLIITDSMSLKDHIRKIKFAPKENNLMGRIETEICRFLKETNSVMEHIYSHNKREDQSRLNLVRYSLHFSAIQKINFLADKATQTDNPDTEIELREKIQLFDTEKSKYRPHKMKQFRKSEKQEEKLQLMSMLNCYSEKNWKWDLPRIIACLWTTPAFYFLDDVRVYFQKYYKRAPSPILKCRSCQKANDTIRHVRFCPKWKEKWKSAETEAKKEIPSLQIKYPDSFQENAVWIHFQALWDEIIEERKKFKKECFSWIAKRDLN